MSKTYTMLQCELEKPQKDHVLLTTAWLPEKFAVVGEYVKLKKKDTDASDWCDGWRVKSTSIHSMRSDEVTERSRDWKRTRKASDI